MGCERPWVCGPAAGQSLWSVSPAPPSTGRAVVGGAAFVAGGTMGLAAAMARKQEAMHSWARSPSRAGAVVPPSRMAVG